MHILRVSLVGLLGGIGVLAAVSYPTLASSLKGHTGTALCAPSPTTGARCSVWAFEEFAEGLNVTSIGFNSTHAVPCVEEGISYHPLWVFLSSQLVNGPFVEINYALHRAEPNGTLEKGVVTCCVNCPGVGAGKECEWHDVEFTSTSVLSGWVTIAYNPASKRYSWLFKGKTIRQIEDSSLGYPFAIAMGGETNYWNNDIGVFAFERIRIFSKSQNKYVRFSPQFAGDTVVGAKTKVKAKAYGGRYQLALERSLPSSGARPYIQVYTDHHVNHEEDACGDTP